MLKIAGKEVLFATSFTLGPDEQATLTPTELPGVTIEITAKKTAAPSSNDFKVTSENNVARMTVPFLDHESFSSAFGLGTSGPGKVTGRVVGQSTGEFMIIHVDAYIERTPNYGAR